MSTSGRNTYHHGDLRAALADAALALLEEQGLGSLSLRAVARRAGVSSAAPYRHYADKEALLAAVATRGFEGLCAALLAADRVTPNEEALAAQGVAYVRYGVAHPALFRLMFGTGPDKTRYPELDQAGEAAYAVLERRVAALVAPERSATLATGCWALVHGLTVLILDGRLEQHDPAAADAASQAILKEMLASTLARD